MKMETEAGQAASLPDESTPSVVRAEPAQDMLRQEGTPGPQVKAGAFDEDVPRTLQSLERR
jgi:hypothetical protein